MQELKNSDFEIVDGEPDVTDWDVVTVQGAKIGDVDDVLFDANARKVRYLIIDLEVNELLLENPYQVLVPIGLATLDEEEDEVILPNITVEQLNALPKYERGKVTPEYEMAVRQIFEGDIVIDTIDEWKDFYEHDHFTESRFFNRKITDKDEKVERVIERINKRIG